MNNQIRNPLGADTEVATEAETEKEVQKEKTAVVRNHSDQSHNSRKKWTTIVPPAKIYK